MKRHHQEDPITESLDRIRKRYHGTSTDADEAEAQTPKALCKTARQILLQKYLPQSSPLAKNHPIQTKSLVAIQPSEFDFILLLFELLKHDPNSTELVKFLTPHLHSALNQPGYAGRTGCLLLTKLFEIPALSQLVFQFSRSAVVDRRNLEEHMETFFIKSIPKISQFLPRAAFTWDELCDYLCLKLKSLNHQIRLYCLQTLLAVPYTSKNSLSIFVQKDVLEKTVNHRRGIFLQLLEDGFHDIRVLTIRCIAKFKLNLEKKQVKGILFYMVNDEHDEVRIEALRSLASLSTSYIVTKQDLEIMLMCLKQSRPDLRFLTYRVIQRLKSQQPQEFLNFLDRLLKVLRQYKEDKRSIYTALKTIGNKYSTFIIPNIKSILQITDLQSTQQPSWKAIAHKAKIILISNALLANSTDYLSAIRQNQALLPFYFLKHFLYVRDVEPYAFQKRDPDSTGQLDWFLKLLPTSQANIDKLLQDCVHYYSQISASHTLSSSQTTLRDCLKNAFKVYSLVHSLTKQIECNYFNWPDILQSCIALLDACIQWLNMYSCQHLRLSIELCWMIGSAALLIIQLHPTKLSLPHSSIKIYKLADLVSRTIKKYANESDTTTILQLLSPISTIVEAFSPQKDIHQHPNLQTSLSLLINLATCITKFSFFNKVIVGELQNLSNVQVHKKQWKGKVLKQLNTVSSESVQLFLEASIDQSLNSSGQSFESLHFLKLYWGSSNHSEYFKILQHDEVDTNGELHLKHYKISLDKFRNKQKQETLHRIQFARKNTAWFLDEVQDRQLYQYLGSQYAHNFEARVISTLHLYQ